MNTIPLAIAVVSFAVPAIAYGIVTGLLLLSMQRSPLSRWLLAATIGTCVWGLMSFFVLRLPGAPAASILILDTAHLALWAAFVGAMTRHFVAGQVTHLGNLLVGASVLLFLAVAVATLQPLAGLLPTRLLLVFVLAVPLLGLLGLEQVFRNATFERRPFLKLLTVAIGWIFVVDIFVYSQALLFESASLMSWSLRGLGIAAVAPLVVLAVKRHPDWGDDLYVSRHVVFYTTSLTAAGIYLIAVAAVGYVIGTSGGTWSPVLQAAFLVLSGAVLGYVLFSRALRARYRVFLAKHFYRNRYDYREEWLRLMQTLVGHSRASSLRERAIQALADIIDSPCGELWLRGRNSDSFDHLATWRKQSPAESSGLPAPLIDFISKTRWVIDTREYRLDPEMYSNAFEEIPEFIAEPAIVVPLVHDDELVGVVWLSRPEALGKLGYEDHDLLKTAGQQVAIFLIQERDQEELSETRQFEAFSRVTAFMMHDLKNMISQQELVVGNAKRHRHRPEFVDDAIRTMDGSVRRMRKLLDRLRGAKPSEQPTRVELTKLIYEIVSSCADREPQPRFAPAGGQPCWVLIDRDKLGMAITHAIRNAQDATDESGHIELSLRSEGGKAIVEVADDGKGMEAAFVRDHLFRPFESTKGASGMGIGAYQILSTLRSAGGDVSVDSAPRRGTRIRMVLPLAGERQGLDGASPA